jgi:hypothetical protein
MGEAETRSTSRPRKPVCSVSRKERNANVPRIGLVEANFTKTSAARSRPTADKFDFFFRPYRSVDAQVRCEAHGVELDLGIPKDSLFVPKPSKARKAHDRTFDMVWHNGQPDIIRNAKPNRVYVIAEFTNFA